MTEKSSKEGISRRDFVAATGAAAAVGGALAAAGTAASAAPSNEICRMNAVTLAEKIRTKQLSATEVTEAVLGRMDKLNPVLGAFCTPSPDVARAQAKAIDADIMAGKTVGPLAGVPVGIKDLVYTKGIRTTSGSIIYKDYVPTEDDVVVERLKAAGAIIIGKTNVPELGYSGASYNLIFPPTNNPWNTERTAGGSSAGSGAAVAAGIGPNGDRQRRRRIRSHSRLDQRAVRPQGLDGSRSALSWHQGRDRAWRIRVGVDRTHRTDHPHSR